MTEKPHYKKYIHISRRLDLFYMLLLSQGQMLHTPPQGSRNIFKTRHLNTREQPITLSLTFTAPRTMLQNTQLATFNQFLHVPATHLLQTTKSPDEAPKDIYSSYLVDQLIGNQQSRKQSQHQAQKLNYWHCLIPLRRHFGGNAYLEICNWISAMILQSLVTTFKPFDYSPKRHHRLPPNSDMSIFTDTGSDRRSKKGESTSIGFNRGTCQPTDSQKHYHVRNTRNLSNSQDQWIYQTNWKPHCKAQIGNTQIGNTQVGNTVVSFRLKGCVSRKSKSTLSNQTLDQRIYSLQLTNVITNITTNAMTTYCLLSRMFYLKTAHVFSYLYSLQNNEKSESYTSLILVYT